MMKLLDLHQKMYAVRWHGQPGDLDELEKQFVVAAEQEGITLEKTNDMLGQLYIPPYKRDELPDHLKYLGENKKVGRPSLGTTKKVSITLPDDIWEKMNQDKKDQSMSSFLREMIMKSYV